MPASSEKQKRFMGMVRGVQKGTTPKSKVGGAARRAALQMTPAQVHDFAAGPVKPMGRQSAAAMKKHMGGKT